MSETAPTTAAPAADTTGGAAQPNTPAAAPAAAPAQAGAEAAPKAGETLLTPAPEVKPGEKGGEAEAHESTPVDIEVKLPDNVPVDAAVLSEFKAVAKDLKLDSAGAQRLIDLQVKATENFAKVADETWQRTKAEWATAAKGDKEYGGPQFDASIKFARTAVEKFATPEFKQMLSDFGFGDHPELIRFMVRVGKAIAEDRTAGTTAAGVGAEKPKSREDILRARYPSMFDDKK